MLDGLLFQPAGTETTQQTRAGIPIYRGGPVGFEEWKFKIIGRVQSIKNQCDVHEPESVRKTENQLVALSAMVVEALEDDALRIAMEIGQETLNTKNGVMILIQRIEDAIPYGDKEDDARDLYHLGAKNKGPLTRQKGESMVSYIARRRRWWQKLKSLDSNMNVSESILADYLLVCSGLDSNQRLMIKTAIGSGEKTFTTVATFLRKHHPTIHENETKDKTRGAFPPPPRPEKSWKPRAKHAFKSRRFGFNNRHSKPRAFNAELDDGYEKEDSSGSDGDAEENDETAYLCTSCAPTAEFEDFEDAIQQDVVCAFMAPTAISTTKKSVKTSQTPCTTSLWHSLPASRRSNEVSRRSALYTSFAHRSRISHPNNAVPKWS